VSYHSVSFPEAQDDVQQDGFPLTEYRCFFSKDYISSLHRAEFVNALRGHESSRACFTCSSSLFGVSSSSGRVSP